MMPRTTASIVSLPGLEVRRNPARVQNDVKSDRGRPLDGSSSTVEDVKRRAGDAPAMPRRWCDYGYAASRPTRFGRPAPRARG